VKVLIPTYFPSIGVSVLLHKACHKNKKTRNTFNIDNVKVAPDSERRETFEALILAYFPLTGVSVICLKSCNKNGKMANISLDKIH